MLVYFSRSKMSYCDVCHLMSILPLVKLLSQVGNIWIQSKHTGALGHLKSCLSVCPIVLCYPFCSILWNVIHTLSRHTQMGIRSLLLPMPVLLMRWGANKPFNLSLLVVLGLFVDVESLISFNTTSTKFLNGSRIETIARRGKWVLLLLLPLLPVKCFTGLVGI